MNTGARIKPRTRRFTARKAEDRPGLVACARTSDGTIRKVASSYLLGGGSSCRTLPAARENIAGTISLDGQDTVAVAKSPPAAPYRGPGLPGYSICDVFRSLSGRSYPRA